MARKGKRRKQKKNKHNRARSQKKNVLRGLLFTTGSGVGYVETDTFEQDIQIPQGDLSTALHGDEVEVLLHPKVEGERQTGEVTKIISKGKRRFVGTLEKNGGVYFLIPDDRRMYTDIFIGKTDHKDARDGYKALVKITSWNDSKKNPSGTVVEVLGPKGEHEVEMRSIVRERGIDYSFPQEVQAEAKKIYSNADTIFKKALEEDGRRDLRSLTVMTIDPEDAKDFDDGLSIEELDDGNFRVGIHIADVSHYVEPDSAIDKEAGKRSFSVYLVDRTIPMLPEELSNDLCSLRPNVDRLAFSALFTLSRDGSVVESWFGKSIIHSDKRFIYEDAQNIIDSGGSSEQFASELRLLDSLAKKLRKERFDAGSVDFQDSEVKFVLDEEGYPVEVVQKKILDAHRLVEEFMLLANREVAKKIDKLCKDRGQEHIFIYRSHDKPDRQKLEELAVFMRAIGYNFELDDKEVTPHIINDLLEQAEGRSEESLVNTMLIRSMAKAEYTTARGKGHFGLSFEYYTHFTSPIRRYPDLIVHRLLDKYLSGERVGKQAFAKYQSVAKHASEKELEVLAAERESIKFKQVEYMSRHIGNTFTGVVVGVSEYGIYVQEEETRAVGMIHISKLGDDYYVLDRKTYSIVGESTKQKFRVGDELKVKLSGVDIDKRQIDFELTQ